jgi:hypothetical protein
MKKLSLTPIAALCLLAPSLAEAQDARPFGQVTLQQSASNGVNTGIVNLTGRGDSNVTSTQKSDTGSGLFVTSYAPHNAMSVDSTQRGGQNLLSVNAMESDYVDVKNTQEGDGLQDARLDITANIGSNVLSGQRSGGGTQAVVETTVRNGGDGTFNLVGASQTGDGGNGVFATSRGQANYFLGTQQFGGGTNGVDFDSYRTNTATIETEQTGGKNTVIGKAETNNLKITIDQSGNALQGVKLDTTALKSSDIFVKQNGPETLSQIDSTVAP